MAEKFRVEKEQAALEAFNWKDGGYLLKTDRIEVKLKYNPEHKGFDLLNYRW